MSETAEQIKKLVAHLSPDAQECLLLMTEYLAADKSFYGQMTTQQREIIEERMNQPRKHVSRDDIHTLLRKFNPVHAR